MHEKDLFSLVMQELYANMGSSPYPPDIPLVEYEYKKVVMYLPKGTIYALNKMGKMSGLSQQKVLEALVNALGQYVADTAERID